MDNPRWGRIIVSAFVYLTFLLYLMFDPETGVLSSLMTIALMAFFAFIGLLVLGLVAVFASVLAKIFLGFWGLHDASKSIDNFLGSGGLGLIPILITILLAAVPISIIANNPYRFPFLFSIVNWLLKLK